MSGNGELQTVRVTSDAACMALCDGLALCVAVDVSHGACFLHYNWDDLLPSNSVHNVSGVTQYVLNRDCTTSLPVSTSASGGAVQSTTPTTYASSSGW